MGSDLKHFHNIFCASCSAHLFLQNQFIYFHVRTILHLQRSCTEDKKAIECELRKSFLYNRFTKIVSLMRVFMEKSNSYMASLQRTILAHSLLLVRCKPTAQFPLKSTAHSNNSVHRLSKVCTTAQKDPY